MVPTVQKSASKISDIFSDGRITFDEIDRMALMVVLYSRQEDILEKINYFCERFYFHRNTVDIGMAEGLTALMQEGTL